MYSNRVHNTNLSIFSVSLWTECLPANITVSFRFSWSNYSILPIYLRFDAHISLLSVNILNVSINIMWFLIRSAGYHSTMVRSLWNVHVNSHFKPLLSLFSPKLNSPCSCQPLKSAVELTGIEFKWFVLVTNNSSSSLCADVFETCPQHWSAVPLKDVSGSSM